jgi:hypothetical protein
MRRAVSTLLIGFAAVGMALTSVGCAPMATVKHWQPAEIDVSGMNRIAVSDFHGEQGAAVAAALSARLWENNFYNLVELSEASSVQHAAYTPCAQQDCLLREARQTGVDGVILGEVREYRCEDQVLQESEFLVHNEEGGKADGGEHLDVGFARRDRVRREGTVTISFRLVDARTGEIRATREASHHYSGETGADDAPLPTRGEVLDTLVHSCVDEFVTMLAPHETESQARLARGRWLRGGSRELRAGNRAAETGVWDDARDHWQEALDRNPDCDAALYNLAIDSAHRQNYSDAEEYAMRALQLRHTTVYAEGLEQIRRHRASCEAAQQQRDHRVLQAAAQEWR